MKEKRYESDVTPKELAERVGVNYTQIYNYIDSGYLAAVNIGKRKANRWVIRGAEADRFEKNFKKREKTNKCPQKVKSRNNKYYSENREMILEKYYRKKKVKKEPTTHEELENLKNSLLNMAVCIEDIIHLKEELLEATLKIEELEKKLEGEKDGV